jgi:Mn-containing catalase
VERGTDEPDPAAANALQEGLGGQFGEMRTMMQYLFQAFNFRGATGKPYKDLLYGVGTEEIGHVELIATTIARLTDGSPRYKGAATKPVDEPGKGGATLLAGALVVEFISSSGVMLRRAASGSREVCLFGRAVLADLSG